MVGRLFQRGMIAAAAFVAVVVRPLANVVRTEVPLVSYRVTRYTTEHGLPHNRVRALLQTRDGYLWVGTLAGLGRLDGVRFKVFDASNTPEMTSDDSINALAEDRQDGSLWVNTARGLLRYHQHRFERFEEAQGFPHPFGDLWPAHEGGLWYSPHPGQLVRLQNHTVKTWQLRRRWAVEGSLEVLGHRINHVQEDEGGGLLVLMYSGLFRFEPATGALKALGPSAPTDTSYRHFIKLADGTLLVAAREGIWRQSGPAWELLETATPGDHRSPARIYPAGPGEFWIPWSSDGPPRLARFKGGRSEFLDLSGLPDYPLAAFWQDHEGHLWLGTESGLCQLRPKAVQVYGREDGLRNDYVQSLTEGPDGTIWLGTAAGVSGVKEGQVTNLPPIAPPNWLGYAEGLLADRRGRVWYGAQRNAVAAFDQGAWASPTTCNPGLGWVRTLYEDRAGRIWVGLDRGVAWLDEAGVIREFPHPLSHPDVRVIHEDRRGDLWFGTYGGGLHRLHDGQITSYTTALGEYNNRAWWIHEDADGVFWVGSRNGLNRFVPPGVERPRDHGTTGPPDRFFTYTTRHGLYENVVNNIQEDDYGYLWLSGLQGIYRVARPELNDVAAGRTPRVQVLAFGEADGMLNSQCNGGVNQPSGCKDREGRLWFPTARGAAMIDPRTIRRNDVPPPVVIEQVKADEEVIFGDGVRPPPPGSALASRASPSPVDQPSTLNHQLSPGRARVLEIHYTANSFAAPQRMRFQYRLEGHDPDWRADADNRRVAFYTNLRPGAYTFRVAACNNHGVWSATPAVFAFTLAPHLWQTWPFYLFCGALVIGLAAAVQAYRLHWQRRLLKLEQQHALADERTRIARDLHDDLGTALTGLALQVDVLRRTGHEGPALSERLAESAAGMRALAERMREVVWAVNPRCDTVSSLASFLEQQTGQFLKADGLRCRLDFPEDIPALPLDGETRHQLALAVREALANAVRHANAREIVLGLRIDGNQLLVRVADNGQGFRVSEGEAHGRGLANMRARLEKIGGQCACQSALGAGTTIELRVPLKP
jgi:signal transduction histidine kinase/ligand-binding sensor domain-containing protein